MDNHNKTKTGAIVCKQHVTGENAIEYEALVFIKDIPLEIDDAQLKVEVATLLHQFNSCEEILIRADINATSNEVWEQYKGLNKYAGKGQIISYGNIR